MEFCFILLQLFAYLQEIALQQNYISVAYANLRLSRRRRGVLLTCLPT